MNITLSITADNGDTLVERVKVDKDATEYTDYHITNVVLDALGEPILRMVRAVQEVHDDE